MAGALGASRARKPLCSDSPASEGPFAEFPCVSCAEVDNNAKLSRLFHIDNRCIVAQSAQSLNPAPTQSPAHEETPIEAAPLPRTLSAAAQAAVSFHDQSTQAATPAQEPAAPLGTFGKYELLQQIAVGGMGIVYKARDTKLDRVVALKTIRAGILAHQDEVSRFQTEARAVARLQHPHIVPILEIGDVDGQLYFTMTFASGTLAQHLARLGGHPHQAAAFMEKVCRALHHAHEQGILHRDLKPGNILLDDKDEPLVSDFGLAKFVGSGADLTSQGQRLGTPAYMAPEQAAGRIDQLSPQTDVWALGVLLYELLTGHKPFVSKGSEDVSHLICSSEPPRPRSWLPSISRELETIILKCLEKEPSKRYPSAAALADDLARWQRGEAILARPQPWISRARRWLRRHPVAVTATATTALLAGLFLLNPFSSSQTPLERLEATLRRGEAAVLIDDKNVPGYKRLVLDPGGLSLNPRGDGIALKSVGACMLELAPNPQCDHFRLEAELRHDSGDGSHGGFYLMHQQEATRDRTYHCSVSLTLYRTLQGAGIGQLNINPLEVTEGPYGTNSMRLGPDIRFVPDAERWCRLAIEVSPEEIVAFFDNQRMGRIPRVQLYQSFEAWKKTNLEAWKKPVLPVSLFPTLKTRGAIGLYCSRGQASFRNVVLRPIKS